MNATAKRAKSIFIEMVGKVAPEQWSNHLDLACVEDHDLRQQIESLLEAHLAADSFLARPAAAVVTTAIPPSVAEQVGTVIGPYKLIEEIGEGGMGSVFLALQKEPVRRKVALKITKPGMDSRQVIARFEAEEQALALMDHPNIAKVLDAGATESGRPYFVMELVHGTPLTEYCDQNALTINQRLELFVSICQAVQHAHQKGIIHRDIKPSNVMVTLHDGVPVPKVIDFGIAKATDRHLTERTAFTSYGQMVGTPLYMSPEQAEMSGLDIDTRSDIYSLGVLLYELLTGSTPFDGDRIREAGYDGMRCMIREEEPPRPSDRISTLLAGETATAISTHRRTDPARLSHLLRGELDWIVVKALEKDRTRRYDTANAFAKDIQRYLNDDPVEACPPSASYRLHKFVRRNKTILTAALSVFAALVIGTVVSLWQALAAIEARRLADDRLIEANAQQERAEHAAEEAQNSEAYSNQLVYAANIRLAAQAWHSGDARRFTDLLDRHRPAVGEYDLRGFEWRYLNQLGQADHRTITEAAVGSCSARHSPDGKYLATGHYDGTLCVWECPSYARVATLRGHEGLVWGIDFAADGQTMASIDRDGMIRLWDVTRWEEIRSFRAHDGLGYGVHFALGGRILLSSGDEPVIRLWDPITGKPLGTLVGHIDEVPTMDISPDGHRCVSGDRSLVTIVWDLDTRQPIRQLRDIDCIDHPRCCRFSPDGDQIAVGNNDKVIRLWDAHTGDLINTFASHDDIEDIAFHPTGTMLASSDRAGVIRTWTLDTTRQEFLRFSQQQKLTASDAAAGDQSGHSTSVNGDKAVVGAYTDDDAGSASGSAYLFQNSVSSPGGASSTGSGPLHNIVAQRFGVDGSRLGSEFLVNTTTSSSSGDHLVPRIGIDSDGSFIVTWYSKQSDGSGDEIYARQYDHHGQPIRSEFLVNAYTEGHRSTSAIAVGPDGNFIVVWHSAGQDGDGNGIFCQRFQLSTLVNLNPIALLENDVEFRVNTETAKNQVYADIAMDADGNYVVVWQSKEQDGSADGIFGQMYDAKGVPIGIEFQVNTYTDASQQYPAVAMSPNGDFVVTWEDYDGHDGDAGGIFAQRYDSKGVPLAGTNPDGTPTVGEFRVNTHTPNYQLRPDVAMDEDGDFVIVWQSKFQGHDYYDVFGQRYRADGTPDGVEFHVNQTDYYYQSAADVAMRSDGAFVVVWQNAIPDAIPDAKPVDTSYQFDIYARSYDLSGNPQGDEFLVNTSTERHQIHPEVVFGAEGRFIITWSSQDQDGSGVDTTYNEAPPAAVDPHAEVRQTRDVSVPGNWPSYLRGHSARIWSIDFSPDGSRLVSASKDGTVLAWSGRDRMQRQSSTIGGTYDIAFAPAEDQLIVAAASGIHIWSPSTNGLGSFGKHFHKDPLSVAVSPNGATIVTGYKKGILRYWNWNTGQMTRSLTAHEREGVERIAFSPDGALVATASWDGTAKLWDTDSGKQLATFEAPPHCLDVAFAPHGQVLAISWEDNAMLIDVESRKRLHLLQGHQNTVQCIAFSPDGRWLATGSHDRTIRVWDARTGETRHVISAHRDKISALAFSPDGRTIASGDHHGTVAFSHVETGQFLYDTKTDVFMVVRMLFSPDAEMLAVALDGYKIVLLHAPPIATSPKGPLATDGIKENTNSTGTRNQKNVARSNPR